MSEQNEVCRAFRNNGKCRYGDDCKFEHSVGEMIEPPPRGQCFNFAENGSCDYGDRCRYLHGEDDDGTRSAAPQVSTKTCHTCGEVGHLKRDCPQGPPAGGNGGNARTCHICGETGHVKRNCPQGGNSERVVTGGGGGGRSRERACYNCGETGHLSRDCEQPENPDARKAPARSGKDNRKCFNCGEFGHIASECPTSELGPKCYNCSEFGHIAGDCTAAPKEDEAAAY